jgi:hypothetical protein
VDAAEFVGFLASAAGGIAAFVVKIVIADV